jgi:hypothetical protein
VTNSCEHDNEPSVSIKGGEFLDELSDCCLVKKDSCCMELVGWLVGWLVTAGKFSQYSDWLWVDDRSSGVRFPAGAGDFSLLHHVQTGSGANPASFSVSIGGSFPGTYTVVA